MAGLVDNRELQEYLYAHIPLSKAMGVEVISATTADVTLSAPLLPNINHSDTVFGGSASAVALLSAGGLLHVRLSAQGLASRVVVQRNTMSYEQPITAAFTATAAAPDPQKWGRFLATLQRHRRARIVVHSVLFCNGARVGGLEGEFVALG